jgi:hypothetical protein
MWLLALACMSFGVMLGIGVLGLCASAQRGDAAMWENAYRNCQRELEVEQGRNCELRRENRVLRRRLVDATP